jgi:hypothetical protein
VKSFSIAIPILGLTLLSTSAARADDVDQAKAYFKAGATAYAAGQFVAAKQALEQAYKLAPRPAILFSMAQAERKQYVIDEGPAWAREAARHFREYIAQVPQGGRRADAVQALAELEPILAKLPAESPADASKSAPVVAKAQTRLMVSSTTPGAHVALDGVQSAEIPLIGEVKAGKHHIKVGADGFFDDERDVVALDGGIVAVDVTLKERPAKLALTGVSGAQVSIDGRLTGTTPLGAPLEIAAGRHLVTVAKNGCEAYSQEQDFARGETKKLAAALPSTTQRKASYVLLVAGAGGLVAGGVLAGLAAHEQSTAQGILDRQATQSITGDDLATYRSAKASRDDLKLAAGVALGAGAVVGITGLLFYGFDQPVVNAPTSRPTDERTQQPSAPKDSPGLDASTSSTRRGVGLAPVWMPGFAGASLGGRF